MTFWRSSWSGVSSGMGRSSRRPIWGMPGRGDWVRYRSWFGEATLRERRCVISLFQSAIHLFFRIAVRFVGRGSRAHGLMCVATGL